MQAPSRTMTPPAVSIPSDSGVTSSSSRSCTCNCKEPSSPTAGPTANSAAMYLDWLCCECLAASQVNTDLAGLWSAVHHGAHKCCRTFSEASPVRMAACTAAP
jgi:hypothetical protein